MVAQFDSLSRHIIGGTEENHETLGQDSRYRSQNSNRRPHEHNMAVFRIVALSLYTFLIFVLTSNVLKFASVQYVKTLNNFWYKLSLFLLTEYMFNCSDVYSDPLYILLRDACHLK
jgi:hypothetical protein